MGQAQRSERRSVPQGRTEERRREQNKAGNAHRSSNRGSLSVIAGNGSQSSAGERARRRSTDSDGLEGLEFWELSREDDDYRMMRLADRDQVRSVQKRSRQRLQSRDRNMDSSYTGCRSAGDPRPVSSIKRRRARKRRLNLYRLFVFFVMIVCLILIYQTTGAIYRMAHRAKVNNVDKNKGIMEVMSEKRYGKENTPPEIIEDFLEVNDYSRPGDKIGKVKNVFVHYTANPGTSAAQNRSYFASLAETQERSASAHFIIGYEGELIQCIPLDEQAYAVATRNEDSVSIECCYLDEDGKFTQETYDTLVHTLAWLCGEYRLSPDDILRHYDCGGKMCPLYYVEHEDAWEKLLADVEAYQDTKVH